MEMIQKKMKMIHSGQRTVRANLMLINLLMAPKATLDNH